MSHPTPTVHADGAQAHRPASDAPAPPPTPGILRRMAAWLYEGVLLFGVVFIAAYLFGTLSQTRHAMDNRGLLQAFIFVVVGIYFTWFWYKGQTLAMKTWNIRITDPHGRPISQWRAMARYVSCWIWFAPMIAVPVFSIPITWAQTLVLQVGWIAIWAILARFHPTRQFWHDAWCGTRLVHFVHPRRK